jgi:hypothetical protein
MTEAQRDIGRQTGVRHPFLIHHMVLLDQDRFSQSCSAVQQLACSICWNFLKVDRFFPELQWSKARAEGLDRQLMRWLVLNSQYQGAALAIYTMNIKLIGMHISFQCDHLTHSGTREDVVYLLRQVAKSCRRFCTLSFGEWGSWPICLILVGKCFRFGLWGHLLFILIVVPLAQTKST